MDILMYLMFYVFSESLSTVFFTVAIPDVTPAGEVMLNLQYRQNMTAQTELFKISNYCCLIILQA